MKIKIIDMFEGLISQIGQTEAADNSNVHEVAKAALAPWMNDDDQMYHVNSTPAWDQFSIICPDGEQADIFCVVEKGV